FDRAFDSLYADLYAHRDDGEARQLVRTLAERFPLVGPVLDIACGTGRLLAPLSGAFAGAVGIDRSPALLRRAREREGGHALVRGDMRELPFAAGAFGAAVSLFTSFGYFDREAEDRAVLAEAARVLTRHGRFVLDYLNPGPTVAHLIPRSSRIVGDREVEERRWLDESGPFLRKEVRVAGDPPVVYQERVRLYEPDRLVAQLSACGLEVRDRWGGYQGQEYAAEQSARLILLAERRP
ncbi:MAG: class I SAM-dependent methyltransferase, partial [Candidatus Eisenbacteria bacterium]|nr:class I SAM-dependent methyltransferase [Candidatus Eisenbacteria bacterium]